MSQELELSQGISSLENDDIDYLFRNAIVTILRKESIRPDFFSFFKCEQEGLDIFHDFIHLGYCTKKQIQYISEKFPVERVEKFLIKQQQEYQEKKIPRPLQEIIFKDFIQYYSIMLTRYQLLLALEEPFSEGDFICEHRGDDFSIWYCEETGSTFLNKEGRVYTSRVEIKEEETGGDTVNICHLVFGDLDSTFIFVAETGELVKLNGELNTFYKEQGIEAIVTESYTGNSTDIDIYMLDMGIKHTIPRKGVVTFTGLYETQNDLLVAYNGIETRDGILEKDPITQKMTPKVMVEDYKYLFSVSRGGVIGMYSGTIVNVNEIRSDTIVEVIESEFSSDFQGEQNQKIRSFYSINTQQSFGNFPIDKEIKVIRCADDVIIFDGNVDDNGIGEITSLDSGLTDTQVLGITSITHFPGGGVDIDYICLGGQIRNLNTGCRYFFEERPDGPQLKASRIKH